MESTNQKQDGREALLKRKLDIEAEINNYPSPIAGCDQQFNYLLEQRGEIRQQLQKLDHQSKQLKANCK